MIQNVVKRDGRIAAFDRDKITDAIFKAVKAVGGNDRKAAEEVTDLVEEVLESRYKEEYPTVEQVQDAVEKALIEKGHAKTAKAYILYRAERTRVREMDSALMSTMKELTFTKSLNSDIKRENANINADTAMGTMLKYGSEASKVLSHLCVLTPQQSTLHKEGYIHIHDLDFYNLTMTCVQISIGELLQKGFFTGHGFLRSPNSITSAASLACIAIQSNQNDMHGGQSIWDFDYGLAPFVAKTYITEVVNHVEDMFDYFDKDSRPLTELKDALLKYATEHNGRIMNKDGRAYIEEQLGNLMPNISEKQLDRIFVKAAKATEKLTFQGMEAVVHNLNTMQSRAGGQVPFSSINFGTDTSEEGRMVIRNILFAIEAGLGKGETAIFPVSIFKVKEGVSYFETDPNYDLFKLAMRVSAKRLFPNFEFIDAPFNLQFYKPGHPETEIATMGCRTRVIGNVVDPERQIVAKRGNLSFTSINLPRLAIEARKDIDKFFTSLDKMLDVVVEQLLDRMHIQAQKHVYNFPMLMEQGVWLDSEKLNSEDTVEEVIKHGTLTVGFIGLAECLKALIGKHHGESEEAQKLGLKIIGHMRQRMDEETQKRKLNFSLIATPAEGLSGRFVKLDRQKYGVIPGVTDKEWYTNSSHIPVEFPISAFKKIQLEAPYHELENGGHICYVELDADPVPNPQAFETIIRCMHDHGVGYGAINHPLDKCRICGYQGVIYENCPSCGAIGNNENIARIRRITGYLVGTTDRFNNAKRAEEQARVKHGV